MSVISSSSLYGMNVPYDAPLYGASLQHTLKKIKRFRWFGEKIQLTLFLFPFKFGVAGVKLCVTSLTYFSRTRTNPLVFTIGTPKLLLLLY